MRKLLHGGSHELRIYDATGTHLSSHGGEGGGPSGFARLVEMSRCGSDSLYALDVSGIMKVFSELIRSVNWLATRRWLAGASAGLLSISAIRAMPDGVDRGVAASLVLSVALLWYALVGRLPGWFRR